MNVGKLCALGGKTGSSYDSIDEIQEKMGAYNMKDEHPNGRAFTFVSLIDIIMEPVTLFLYLPL